MSPIIRPFSMPRFGAALAVGPLVLLIACTHDQPKALVPTVATAAPIPAPVAATPPRGSDSYNEELGLRRADTARDYLVSKGVSSDDITVTSRGKPDATGDEAAGWQLDRRIAIDKRSAIAAQ